MLACNDKEIGRMIALTIIASRSPKNVIAKRNVEGFCRVIMIGDVGAIG